MANATQCLHRHHCTRIATCTSIIWTAWIFCVSFLNKRTHHTLKHQQRISSFISLKADYFWTHLNPTTMLNMLNKIHAYFSMLEKFSQSSAVQNEKFKAYRKISSSSKSFSSRVLCFSPDG